MSSQTACFGFMIQLEDVIGKAEEEPFDRYIVCSSGEETAKAHILFGHGKDSLRLDRAVDAQQTPLLRGDAQLHYLFFHQLKYTTKARHFRVPGLCFS